MGVAPGDAVEMEGRAELGERVRVLRKERAVTIHVEFQRQAVLHKGTREEIEVSQEVFLPVDVRAGAEPGAIVQQVQPQIVPWVAGEPAVGRGIQLPECPALEALPAAGRSGGPAGRFGLREVVGIAQRWTVAGSRDYLRRR